MNIKALIPTPLEIGREAIIVIGGAVLAAIVIRQFPKLLTFVSGTQIVVKDEQGNII